MSEPNQYEICINPFQNIQIQNTGDIYFCCPHWNNRYSIGNILEMPFDKIWNGEKANIFRKSIIKNSYQYCHRDICMPMGLINNTESLSSMEYPTSMEISFDRHCNVRCIFCRECEETEFNPAAQKMYENFEELFTPVLKHLKIVHLSSSGELFASRQSLDVLEKIIKINPNIKFNIISNGTLFSKENIEKYDLTNRIKIATISLHAIKKSTYNKLVKHGNYDAVIKNLKNLAEMQNKGLLSIHLNFVINSINYREMPEYIQFSKSLGRKTQVFFLKYLRNIDSDKLEKKLDVTNPQNSKYNQFIKMLENPIFFDENCHISNTIWNLEPIKRHFWDIF